MKKRVLSALVALQLLGAAFAGVYAQSEKALRAPAYPLVTIDPYTCCWSFGSTLNEQSTKHWTGVNHPLIGSIRVDGVNYIFMGQENTPMIEVLPMADSKAWTGQFTFDNPSEGWQKPDYPATDWKEGKAAFGSEGTKLRRTNWETKDIWVRREFNLDQDYSNTDLYLKYSHDDIFELYINGQQVVKTGYEWNDDVLLALNADIRKNLKKGKNVIAAHCHNQGGGSYVDFGLFIKPGVKSYFSKKATQTSAKVMPTQTIYTFQAGAVDLKLTFTTPLLCEDLSLLSRPVSYISYDVKSRDKAKHDVQVYFEATPEWTVHETAQAITSRREESKGLTFLSTGTKEQKMLARSGDNVRIEWGYLYLVGKTSPKTNTMVGDYSTVKTLFGEKGRLSNSIDEHLDGNMHKQMTVLAYSEDLGKVGGKTVSSYVMIGYDDVKSIQYHGENLDAYWRKNGEVTIQDAFQAAAKDYTSILSRCQKFDQELVAEATANGGKQYADLCALLYRQTIAAHKLVNDKKGNLLFFSKENFSNGSIGTVDLTYPSSPLFLRYSTELTKGLMNFIFEYSESGKWTKPFAAHDLGTYPLANGQTYGGDMPVEESGNMLIITTAVAMREGNADYAKKHWAVLTTWANYLIEKGLDPENQLCSDDFAGHSAHNTNLSIKAIIGIAGYGKLADMLGEKEVAKKYTEAAQKMAKQWVEMAEDGDHYRLSFDAPGSWSQKYNLVWDKLFGFNMFPETVAEKEVAFYLNHQEKYGLPLDSRKTYTKSDWTIWTASLAKNKSDFEKLIAPIYRYADETPNRIPFSDWHETLDAKSLNFRARSVVGAFYIKLLDGKFNQKK